MVESPLPPMLQSRLFLHIVLKTTARAEHAKYRTSQDMLMQAAKRLTRAWSRLLLTAKAITLALTQRPLAQKKYLATRQQAKCWTPVTILQGAMSLAALLPERAEPTTAFSSKKTERPCSTRSMAAHQTRSDRSWTISALSGRLVWPLLRAGYLSPSRSQRKRPCLWQAAWT